MRQLSITLNQNDYIKRIIPEISNIETSQDVETLAESFSRHEQIPALSEEATRLLIEAAQDKNGIIMRLHTLGGTTIQTNEKQFAEQGNPRSEAEWEAAVDELENHTLIQDRAMKGEVYFMTHEGYKVADILIQS